MTIFIEAINTLPRRLLSNVVPFGKSTSLIATGMFSLLALTGVTFSETAQADIIGSTHTTLVSEFASFNTPGVVDGRVEAIAIVGDTVFVGGTFTRIHDPLSDEIIEQPHLFAYSKSSGDILRDFDPKLNNPVLALERTGDGTGVFAGGVFTNLNGEIRRGLVKIDNNGDRVSGFGARLNASVSTMVRLDDTLYIGGSFNVISGTQVENLAAIDTTTGAVDSSLNLDFDGVLTTPTTINTSTQSVDELDITPDGRLLVVVGNFSIIDGISRHRLAVIELEGEATVSAWNTDVYDVQCPVSRFPQYIFGMDVSPDGSYFVTGSSGFIIRDNPNDPDDTRDNPACDTTNRFELNDLTNTDVQPTWTNHTGGDSVYEVVSTGHAVYIGGHFEFLDNDTNHGGNGNNPGRGSTQRAGLAALDPLNGLTLRDWQSDRNPRGLGVFAMISEDEGLYFGDDTNFLNGTEHKKFKFLPLSNDAIVRPDEPTLPTTILSTDGNALVGSSFDGTTVGAPNQLLNAGWQTARGGMFVGGKLFHADDSGTLLSSVMSDATFESPTTVDLFGMIELDWALSRLTSMYFNYQMGRVYYTLENDSRLFYRYFTPETEFFGNDEYVALEQGDIVWDDVTGMDVIDNHLYFTRSDGVLYRSDIDGASVISGTTVLVDDTRDWNSSLLAFLGEGELVGQLPVAQFEFDASGSQNAGRVRNFTFDVVAGEPVVVRLEWFDPDAQLNLFVRDANDVLVALDNSSADSPKYVTAPAGVGGTYTAVVIVAEGSTAYNLQINPTAAPPEPPPALADFEFSSSGSNSSGRFQRFNFDVVAGERIDAQVIWDSVAAPEADVRIFLRDENNNLIVRDTDGSGSPATVSALATTGGQWSLRVIADSDVTVEYDVLIDTTVPPPTTVSITEQPVDVTIFEGEDATFTVRANGSGTLSYQWFAGNEAITGQTSDTLNLASLTLADSGTVYSVEITDDNSPVTSDNVTLTVNAIPLADFEFSSNGSNSSRRFQRFNFDVVAGERVDAQVIWDSVAAPGADVRIFLRDDNNDLIVRDTDGSGSPATVSALATTSGRWSLRVLADSDITVEYDVLIDTTTEPQAN